MLYFLKERVINHEFHIRSFHIQFSFIGLNIVNFGSVLTGLVKILLRYPI